MKKNKMGKIILILGMISLLFLFGLSKIFNSMRFFKQWKFYTNLISIEQKKLSLINRKVSNNLLKLFRKRNKWQNNLFNNLVAKLFRVLNINKILEIFIGDIKNIRKSSSKNKLSNQMINNYWSFDKLIKKIEDKSEEYGIKLNKITEEYSSRTCPMCLSNDKNNCNDRSFICCNCGYSGDRDIIGARNILSKGMYGSFKSIQRDEIIPLEVFI